MIRTTECEGFVRFEPCVCGDSRLMGNPPYCPECGKPCTTAEPCMIDLIYEEIECPDCSYAKPERWDKFTEAYLTALEFTETPESMADSGPFEPGAVELSEEVKQQAAEDCAKFQANYANFLNKAYEETGNDEAQAGHDFWLTRNGHGAGFWDGAWGTWGDTLTDASKTFGEVSIYHLVSPDRKTRLNK